MGTAILRAHALAERQTSVELFRLTYQQFLMCQKVNSDMILVSIFVSLDIALFEN